ncbi:MAG TPA: GyrI-like domain-containing protein [Acidobacteriaceae bacterium]|nr:GyrI-like domain-containing protein [Acidobacteriaceae bacterium]
MLPAFALIVGLQQQPPSAPAAPAATPATAPAATATVPKIENQESFTVVGVTVRTNNAAEAGGQGQIPGVWQNAMSTGQLEQIPNRVGEGYVVVYSDFASDHGGEFNYTLGVRVSSADNVPADMVKRTVAAGKYAIFQSEQGAPQEVIPALWQHINSLSPEQMGGQRAYQTDFETYGAFTDPGSMQMTAHIGLK